MRSSEPGYILAAMNDPSGRRGIWYRQADRSDPIDICGGREGDDAHVTLKIGDVITPRMLFDLEDILSRGAWMVEEQKEHAARMSTEPDRIAQAGQFVEHVVTAYLDEAKGK